MTHSIDTLVSSRICHDLISPVGAIGNGVELMEGLAATIPEIGLIGDSVNNAKAKLRFFRICFGQLSNGTRMSANEAEAIATAMIQTSRLTLEWQIQSVDLPHDRVKLLFLLLLCVETALPIGGSIVVREQNGGFVVQADGKRVKMQNAWRVFEDETVAITPAQVQFPLAQAFGEIRLANTDTSLTVRF